MTDVSEGDILAKTPSKICLTGRNFTLSLIHVGDIVQSTSGYATMRSIFNFTFQKIHHGYLSMIFTIMMISVMIRLVPN